MKRNARTILKSLQRHLEEGAPEPGGAHTGQKPILELGKELGLKDPDLSIAIYYLEQGGYVERMENTLRITNKGMDETEPFWWRYRTIFITALATGIIMLGVNRLSIRWDRSEQAKFVFCQQKSEVIDEFEGVMERYIGVNDARAEAILRSNLHEFAWQHSDDKTEYEGYIAEAREGNRLIVDIFEIRRDLIAVLSKIERQYPDDKSIQELTNRIRSTRTYNPKLYIDKTMAGVSKKKQRSPKEQRLQVYEQEEKRISAELAQIWETPMRILIQLLKQKIGRWEPLSIVAAGLKVPSFRRFENAQVDG